MASIQPKFDIRLQMDRTCYLSCQPRFSLVLSLTFSSDQPVTIIKQFKGHDLGMLNQLAQSLDCSKTESGKGIVVLGNTDPNFVSNASSHIGQPLLMNLHNKRSGCITFNTASDRRGYEFVIDSSKLQRDKKYAIHCKRSALKWWILDSKQTVFGIPRLTCELPSLRDE